MRRLSSSRLLATTFCALLFVGGGACRAQTTFTVSLDTSSLIGHAGGPYSLDFQLGDGSGTSDGNNTATLSGFNFGSGAATGAATTSGGASGSLTLGAALTDSGFSNELFQSFTPGSTLSFIVSLTGKADIGPNPDEFSFALLDGASADVPTTGSAGAFVIADITPQGITRQTFAGTGPYAAIAAPIIGSPVPEMSTRPVFALGLVAGLLGLCLRKRSIGRHTS